MQWKEGEVAIRSEVVESPLLKDSQPLHQNSLIWHAMYKQRKVVAVIYVLPLVVLWEDNSQVPQLPLVQRQGLYAEIRRIVLETPGKAAHLEITLPLSTEYVAPPGWQLTRRMNYSFSPTATPTTYE